jgi:phosphopantetheinyl transferase
VLAALPARVRPFAFTSAWTRKEAHLKATGEGSSLRSLRKTKVTFAPGEPERLLNTPDDSADAPRWALFSLCPGQGTVGALCAEEPVRSLALFDEVGGERTT